MVWKAGSRMGNFDGLVLVLRRLRYAEVQWAGEVVFLQDTEVRLLIKALLRKGEKTLPIIFVGKDFFY